MQDLTVMISRVMATLFAAATVATATSVADEPSAPNVGDKAIDFTASWTTKEKVHFQDKLTLSERFGKGNNIVLAFFPAAWTGG